MKFVPLVGLYEADGVTQGSTIKWKTVGAGAAT